MPVIAQAHEAGTSTGLARARLSLLCACAMTGIGCVWGWNYLAQRAVMYVAMREAIQPLQAALQANPCDTSRPVLAINFPEWFFVKQQGYLVGHDGLKTISERGGLDELIAMNFSVRPAITSVSLPDIQSASQPYKSLGEAQTYESMHARIRASAAVLLTRWDAESISVQNVGCAIASTAISDAGQGTRFAQNIALIDAKAQSTDIPGMVDIELVWQGLAQSQPARDVTVFVQLLNADGRVIAQVDGYPIGGAAPMHYWQRGEAWRDRRVLRASESFDPAQARVLVGLYDAVDGKRIDALQNGARLPDDAVMISITTAKQQ
jgi:hypothetical protein